MPGTANDGRHMGLWGATGIGVGAIVGGGILALAGVAFAATGPSAVLAFGLNGVIALLTALSFAEVSARFPLSGGTYVFAKKVLSLDAAFVVGWVVWFASIAASALYAVGFASFASLAVEGILGTCLGKSVTLSQPVVIAFSLGAILVYAAILLRSNAGGGQWINVAKVLVFVVIILGGIVYVWHQPFADVISQLDPFFAFGSVGLIQAMGFSFIALQGFDLIAAVAGEIREPERTIPKAMLLSLGIALAIYIPLLLLVATVVSHRGCHSPSLALNLPRRWLLSPLGISLDRLATGWLCVLVCWRCCQRSMPTCSRHREWLVQWHRTDRFRIR